MQRNSSENLAIAMTKLVAVEGHQMLLEELLVANMVVRDYEPTLAGFGDCVSRPGGDLLSLDTHVEATFQIPDVTKVIGVPDLLRLYMQPAVAALAEKIDTSLLEVLCRRAQNVGPMNRELLVTAFTGEQGSVCLASKDALRELRRLDPFLAPYGYGAYGTGEPRPVGSFLEPGWLVFYTNLLRSGGLVFHKRAAVLASRRITKPLPGTGLIAERAEYANIGLLAQTRFDPGAISQQFELSILYGVGDCEKDRPVRGFESIPGAGVELGVRS